MTGRPSAYLYIASKVGVGNELVCHKFIQTLSPEINPVIAAVKNAFRQELGTLADELVSF